MYPRLQLRILRKENNQEPDRLQYRFVHSENETSMVSTNWEDVSVHIEKEDGTIVDQITNKPVY